MVTNLCRPPGVGPWAERRTTIATPCKFSRVRPDLSQASHRSAAKQGKGRRGPGANDYMTFGSQKGPTKPKNRTNSTKESSEQFEGATGSLPSKTGVLRQIAPGSSPERSAKSLSHSFFVVPLYPSICAVFGN